MSNKKLSFSITEVERDTLSNALHALLESTFDDYAKDKGSNVFGLTFETYQNMATSFLAYVELDNKLLTLDYDDSDDNEENQ